MCNLLGIDESLLERVDVSRLERIGGSSSLKGNQIKWKHEDRYVKLDLWGYESVSEVLSSYLLEFSDLRPTEYVSYYQCRIFEDGKYLGIGCYSFDFVGDLAEITSGDILDSLMLPYSIGYEAFIKRVSGVVEFNIKHYVSKILAIDSIIRNDDRHFNNICFLFDGYRYYPAPIFDFGVGCLSDVVSYPMLCSFGECYGGVYAKPFSVIFDNNLKYVVPMGIDVESFLGSVVVSDRYSVRALETIKRGLSDTKGRVWKEFSCGK